ncbi:MAG: hypothetical protein Q4A32_02690 [Lachnospiraceae bacterium]|nr:hypothetical protein [Lachnospiraceae bacterium]
MGKISGKLKRKIRSRSGESIAETLVALLLAAVALTMLAGAMTSSAGMILKSRDRMNLYYDISEDVVKRTSGTGVRLDEGLTLTDNSGRIATESYTVTYYLNDTFKRYPVVTYEKETTSEDG